MGLPSSRKGGGHANEPVRDLGHEKAERLKVVGLLQVNQNLERREGERLCRIDHGSPRRMPAGGCLEATLSTERLLARARELSRGNAENPHASFRRTDRKSTSEQELRPLAPLAPCPADRSGPRPRGRYRA